VTSREVLRIDGETVYCVPPLDVPAPGRDGADHILSHSAVELFIDRSKALVTGLSLRAGELPSVGAICRQLDGIPLAIEFAAAHVATVGIQPVAIGLNDRFALLTRGRRPALSRHRTLRAVFDWSYELLSEVEQRLLRHLAIVSGGFTTEAAAAVVNNGIAARTSVLESIATPRREVPDRAGSGHGLALVSFGDGSSLRAGEARRTKRTRRRDSAPRDVFSRSFFTVSVTIRRRHFRRRADGPESGN
jgi:hypothetical protein